jgi:hypothetical protein
MRLRSFNQSKKKLNSGEASTGAAVSNGAEEKNYRIKRTKWLSWIVRIARIRKPKS